MSKEEIIEKIKELLNNHSKVFSQQFVDEVISKIKEGEETSLDELNSILNDIKNKISEHLSKDTAKGFINKVKEKLDLER